MRRHMEWPKSDCLVPLSSLGWRQPTGGLPLLGARGGSDVVGATWVGRGWLGRKLLVRLSSLVCAVATRWVVAHCVFSFEALGCLPGYVCSLSTVRGILVCCTFCTCIKACAKKNLSE